MHICEYQAWLKVKDTSLEEFEPKWKVKIQVRCDLHVNHYTARLVKVAVWRKHELTIICRYERSEVQE